LSFFDELKRRNVFRVGIAYVIASWVVLQVADLVFEAINAPDWVLQAMMFVVLLGFAAALIIAWAYELTPEGIKREEDVDRSQTATHETATKLNHITIGLVIAAIAIVAIDRLLPEKGSEPFSQPPVVSADTEQDEKRALTPTVASVDNDSPSIAVLPFVNMSSDPEQEFFSDGISEEILNVLTRIPNLKVAARTSSFQFKGQNLDIADIARQLRVNHVLEGSVRKAGDQLRITAQLIEAETGYHLWSDTFDRKLENVFAIQDEIAGAIASELRSRLAPAELTSVPVDTKAYELYLKGRSLVATRKEAALFEAIELFGQALEIAPDYAAAMGTLAKAYMVLPWFSRSVSAGEAREQARDWAQQALAIDKNNTDALAALAIVTSESDMNPGAALELMRKAVAANPGSVTAHNFYGDLAVRTGDLETAMIHESRAAELDPLGPVQLTDLANVHFMLGNWDRVLELAGRALELNPEFGHALVHQTDAWFAKGDMKNLNSMYDAIPAEIRTRRDLRGLEMMIHIANGREQQAHENLARIAQMVRAGEYSPVTGAFNAIILKDFDTAGEMLMLALEQKDGTWTYPAYARLPEQAPDSEPWQEFWRQPGPHRFAEIRRSNRMNPNAPGFGDGADQ